MSVILILVGNASLVYVASVLEGWRADGGCTVALYSAHCTGSQDLCQIYLYYENTEWQSPPRLNVMVCRGDQGTTCLQNLCSYRTAPVVHPGLPPPPYRCTGCSMSSSAWARCACARHYSVLCIRNSSLVLTCTSTSVN